MQNDLFLTEGGGGKALNFKDLNSFRLRIWRQQEGITCLLLCVGFVRGMMHKFSCRVRQLNACSLPFSWSDYKRTLLVVVIIKRGGITTALRSSFFNIASSRCASTYLPPPSPLPSPTSVFVSYTHTLLLLHSC